MIGYSIIEFNIRIITREEFNDVHSEIESILLLTLIVVLLKEIFQYHESQRDPLHHVFDRRYVRLEYNYLQKKISHSIQLTIRINIITNFIRYRI